MYGGGFRNLPRFFSPAAPKMRFPWTIPLLACSESKSVPTGASTEGGVCARPRESFQALILSTGVGGLPRPCPRGSGVCARPRTSSSLIHGSRRAPKPLQHRLLAQRSSPLPCRHESSSEAAVPPPKLVDSPDCGCGQNWEGFDYAPAPAQAIVLSLGRKWRRAMRLTYVYACVFVFKSATRCWMTGGQQ